MFFTTALEENATYVPLDESSEMDTASGSRNQIKNLISQVNHLSVNGLMDHLLSFYICMRWVPDAEFVKLAENELSTQWVDEDTQAQTEVTRNSILASFLKSDITPMRCSSGFHVQDIANIDLLIRDFETETSTLNMLARTIERILTRSQWGP